MNFELLKKSHLKRNIMIGIVAVLIISAVILNPTRAKYRVTKSIPLVNGTINYSLPDFNVIGLYINGEEATELDSSKSYTLDTTQSSCTYKDGSTINNLNISYDSDTGELQISPFTTKGTKCTLYFEERVSVSDTLLANYPTLLTRDDFSTTVTNTTTGTIYYEDTSKGRTYYFAGNPTDNWVRWAGFYWRIIRINEDGTIRMIYQGTSANATGTGTQLASASTFNSSHNNNAYVGFKYTSGQVHGIGTNSTILTALNNWFNTSGIAANYANDLDGNAGFCNDRQPSTSTSTSNGSGGTGTTTTYYGAFIRLFNGWNTNNALPSFECANSSDLFTTSGSSQGNRALTNPIGLITADEVVYAGGIIEANNQSYYLFTGQNYWTMSPCEFSGGDFSMFYVSSGMLTWGGGTYSVRPVINLRADVTIQSGDGTSSNPYVVS